MKIDDAVRESLRRRAQAVKIDEDVWEAFAARQPLPAVEPSRRRRVATGVLAAVLAVVPFYALWLAFRPGPSTKPVGAPNSVIAFEFSENSPFLDGPGSGRPVLSIFTVSPDGSDAHRLSPDDGAEYGNVTWSPDGTRLAFDRFERDGDSSQEGIYVMRADGSDLHEIYRSALKPVSVRDIAWSPDGSQIAFVRTDYSESGSEAEDSLDVFVMNADGSNLRQVTRGTQFTSVGWTPDGKGFLVTIQRLADDGEHFTYDLGVVGLDGKIDRELTDDGVSMEPSWSPDGTRITFLRSRGENSRDSSRDVMVMSGEGGPATALTHLEPGAVAAWPTWAPDGSRVAYSVFDSFPKSCSIEVTDMSGMTTSVIGGVELGGCPERLSWQPAAATRPAESDGPEVITKPMGIPISLRYPSDWFAQSVSQTTVPDGTGDKQIGLVISNLERVRGDALGRCVGT